MKKHIMKCCQCVKGETTEGPHGKYYGNPSPGTGPHQLPESGAWEGEGEEHLVMNGHFTRYGQACMTQSKTAQVLWDSFIIHHGLPEKILSDQGRNFESELTATLC